MPSKKRVCHQQFGIIHLQNLDLTYIRNPDRNKIMFMPFHLLKNYIRNSSLFFISFFTLPPTGKVDGNHDPLWPRRVEFCHVSIFAKLVCQTIGVALLGLSSSTPRLFACAKGELQILW
jgi:hypothetical protein